MPAIADTINAQTASTDITAKIVLTGMPGTSGIQLSNTDGSAVKITNRATFWRC